MKSIPLLFNLSAILILLNGIPVQAEKPVEVDEIAVRARGVLKQHCLRCHSGEGSEGGDFNVLSQKDLLDSAMVESKKPNESILLQPCSTLA